MAKQITNSVQPDSAFFGPSWPNDFAIPESLSTAGWTSQAPGYEQQTFLGASIMNFSMNGGYGDSSSTLSVDLIVDEYNKSDEKCLGDGDDVYHNGTRDEFRPPFVGSPVFFKFGKERSSVKEAFDHTIDDLIKGSSEACKPDKSEGTAVTNANLINLTSLSDNQLYDLETGAKVSKKEKGRACGLTFGGILQSYTQNRSSNGNPLYSVQVTDPREILSNVKIILNNYTGSIHDNDNLMNVYGFLEYEAPCSWTDGKATNPIKRSINKDGTVEFSGDDTLETGNDPQAEDGGPPAKFPMTGKGFSRRSEQGIPFYRVGQAIQALVGYNGELPKEYKEPKFFNTINFRGFKYIVDLTGLPALPDFYYLDFDEMSLLELALELCDVMNRDLFVTLLPIVENEYCQFLFQQNNNAMGGSTGDEEGEEQPEFYAGIIRCDAIDRSKQQDIGSIKSYLDDLEKQQIYVENRDVGFEVSNIVTDKFIAGAQTSDMYFFSTMEDRDTETPASLGQQYNLDTMLSQQVIPYYGGFGNNVCTIPKGFGSYQQILLDSRHLNANGVGAFYVTTEMELRCALASFSKWKEFLMQYNDVYMESTEENDIIETSILSTTAASDVTLPPGLAEMPVISQNYEVTVPRSLWPCRSFGENNQFDDNGLPRSPCNPPYGYPLYYKRATQIGIPEGGLLDITYTWNSQVMPALAKLKNLDPNSEKFTTTLDSILERLNELHNTKDPETGDPPPLLAKIIEKIEELAEAPVKDLDFDILFDEVSNVSDKFNSIPRTARKSTENAQRVYDFLKNIASECLGKKYLVKLPRKTYDGYNAKHIHTGGGDAKQPKMKQGPYGFEPLPQGKDMASLSYKIDRAIGSGPMSSFLEYDSSDPDDSDAKEVCTNETGAFKSNYNPFTNTIETNYIPETQGGFFTRNVFKDIYDEDGRNRAISQGGGLPKGVKQLLIPSILSNFTNSNGRFSAYARFDNSQNLSFDGINQNDLNQAVIDGDKFVPDAAYKLDNLNESNTDFTRFYNPNDDENKDKDKPKDKPLDKQVAFLKCTVDQNIYYAPQIEEVSLKVGGIKTKEERLVTLPKQVLDPETDKLVYTHGYVLLNHLPEPEMTSSAKRYDFKRMDQPDDRDNIALAFLPKTFKGVVDSSLEHITDKNEAYALITLPGRIVPTVDARFRDGTFQKFEKVKHYLTLDVVKDVAEFSEPKFQGDPPDILSTKNQENCTSTKYQNAKELYKTVLDKLSYAFPQKMEVSAPSPVIPDLIALPLTSTERFYGPWISSEVDTRTEEEKRDGTEREDRYKDLGGAVEFMKDENLAPWNYFGYTKLNEAGKVRARFANSLLLLSERGGFVVPDAPSGLSLGRELKSAGPLITSINVDISSNSIKTTTQLDLYTVSFGKLHKQKEMEISRASRERKKLSDEKNALIRKGLGKAQSDQNYNQLYKTMTDQLKILETTVNSNVNAPKQPATEFVATVKSEVMDRFKPGADGSPESKVEAKRTGIDIGLQSKKDLQHAAESFPTATSANKSYYNSAGGNMGEMFTPASMEPYHQNMPFNYDGFIEARDLLFFESNGDIDSDGKLDVTIYED